MNGIGNDENGIANLFQVGVMLLMSTLNAYSKFI